jgi:hypothetical protein
MWSGEAPIIARSVERPIDVVTALVRPRSNAVGDGSRHHDSASSQLTIAASERSAQIPQAIVEDITEHYNGGQLRRTEVPSTLRGLMSGILINCTINLALP